MTDIRLSAREKEVRAKLLCSGRKMSIKEVSRQTGIPSSSVYRAVESLLRKGAIIEYFHIVGDEKVPYNPRLFGFPGDEDPNPRRGLETENGNHEGVMRPAPSMGISLKDLQTGISDPYNIAVSTAKECPPGYMRGHVAGHIQFEVLVKGNDDIRHHGDNIVLGTLFSEEKANGRYALQRSGVLHVFNQELTFTYRWFPSTGRSFLLLNPSSVWIDPDRIRDEYEIDECFLARARVVGELFCQPQNGWQMSEPTMHGKAHKAFVNHPLIPFMSDVIEDEDADLKVDKSTGDPELEIEHDDPDAMMKARIVKNFPTLVAGLMESSEEKDGIIARMEARIARLERINELQEQANRLQDDHIGLMNDALVSQQEFSATLAEQLVDFRDKCMAILTDNQMILSSILKTVTDFGSKSADILSTYSATVVRQNKVIGQMIDQANALIKLNTKQLRAFSADRSAQALDRIEEELRAQRSLDNFEVPGHDGGGGYGTGYQLDTEEDSNRRWEGYE